MIKHEKNLVSTISLREEKENEVEKLWLCDFSREIIQFLLH